MAQAGYSREYAAALGKGVAAAGAVPDRVADGALVGDQEEGAGGRGHQDESSWVGMLSWLCHLKGLR
ncbi:hypothetical protein GCM10010339_16020 [Streptomyces alanosinicus]|uniref:Uncharacterized protein n=1 Tax=Streptomyces alanosinicus TaxID=68171 RepID=A0A919D104_9ACTN|nr:hypothetical protein GCM10010339_16020 [Streptomyces alanosinicus]